MRIYCASVLSLLLNSIFESWQNSTPPLHCCCRQGDECGEASRGTFVAKTQALQGVDDMSEYLSCMDPQWLSVVPGEGLDAVARRNMASCKDPEWLPVTPEEGLEDMKKELDEITPSAAEEPRARRGALLPPGEDGAATGILKQLSRTDSASSASAAGETPADGCWRDGCWQTPADANETWAAAGVTVGSQLEYWSELSLLRKRQQEAEVLAAAAASLLEGPHLARAALDLRRDLASAHGAAGGLSTRKQRKGKAARRRVSSARRARHDELLYAACVAMALHGFQAEEWSRQ